MSVSSGDIQEVQIVEVVEVVDNSESLEVIISQFNELLSMFETHNADYLQSIQLLTDIKLLLEQLNEYALDIAGMVLFCVLVVICYFVYKFFNMFF